MHYQRKAARTVAFIKVKAILITILVHFLLLVAIVLSGNQDARDVLPEQIKSLWKQEEVKP